MSLSMATADVTRIRDLSPTAAPGWSQLRILGAAGGIWGIAFSLPVALEGAETPGFGDKPPPELGRGFAERHGGD